jgi:hypothetical protein
MGLKDKTAVVTGGASGLGEATVRRFGVSPVFLDALFPKVEAELEFRLFLL